MEPVPVGYGAREEAVFIYIFGSCDWYEFLWVVLPGTCTGYILMTDVCGIGIVISLLWILYIIVRRMFFRWTFFLIIFQCSLRSMKKHRHTLLGWG